MIFTTEIQTIDKGGNLKTFGGPILDAESWELAEIAADHLNLTIVGELIKTIETDIDINMN